MNSRTIDVVTDWETVAAPDGYEGLHELADAEFSGAVSAGMTWAFFLNGRVVGVFEGDIEDFEDAELTAYRAADPSLPLLFSMQERGGETQARYYTNQTSLSDADQTLSNGGFTGYIELSENVLSGDYYVVYHGGKSMSAAFVGSSERLLTGDEAFETAADEVGIYEVIDADVELVEIPDRPEPESSGSEPDGSAAAAATGEEDAGEDAGGGEQEADADTEPAADASEEADGDAGTTDDAGAVDDAGSSADDAEAAVETADDDGVDEDTATPGPDSEEEAEAADGSDEATASEPVDAGADGPRTVARDSETATADAAGDASPREGAAGGSTAAGEQAAGSESGADGVFSDEERWREAKTIPSLDPEKSSSNGTTESAGDAPSQSASGRVAELQQRQAARQRARDRSASDATQSSAAPRSGGGGAQSAGGDRLKKRLSRARDRIDELEAEREALREERDSLQGDREELKERVNALEAEREEQRDRIDELEAERETLKAEVQRLEAELDGGPESAGETSMSAEQALSGTNLFVRYDRKGEATLEHAHAGDASREDVAKNLRLEHHTTFETDGLVVDGRPYAEFLRDSTEYSFAEWLVTDLLYEIGETGNRSSMAGVFDSIPEIDRIELYGTVGVDTDEGVERRDFDVIFRDKMGDPLFVADINDSRNATTEAMVGSLVSNTGVIAEDEESLSAGFYVTESFFEPGALETVTEETGGGLLSRSKKRSYVKLSRKQGYHLCLVEARNGEFHLNVPGL
ncbi:DUF7527 domain-containing protein [Halobellus rufus]|uniref:DUF7527 domain-containing protein n=1 Tax=Halobellus rufus TaxID=1448860 RepID=UPI000679DAAD|nr:hypothetical protein [Halobellus rufus]